MTEQSLPRAAVIMAGGVGERLWPLSRRRNPKQVLPLDVDGKSLLQTAHERLTQLVPSDRVFVATTEALAPVIREKAPYLNPDNVISEPMGRNTAGCLALACATLEQRLGPCVMAVVTADQRIGEPEVFIETFERGYQMAEQRGELVVFGLRPTHPETGYGYVEMGEVVDEHASLPCHRVAAFREKPPQKVAEEYFASGKHLWNSGMFVWRTETLRSAFATHSPAHTEAMTQMAALDLTAGEPPAALRSIFESMPNISIDYAVLEKAQDVAVLPATFPWMDMGGWESVRAILAKDADDNATEGQTVLIDSKGCTVHTSGPLVATCGLEDVAIIVTPDAVLVCPRDRLQEIKSVVTEIQHRPDKEGLT